MISLPAVDDESGIGKIKLYRDSTKKDELKIPDESCLKNVIYKNYDGSLNSDQMRAFYDT